MPNGRTTDLIRLVVTTVVIAGSVFLDQNSNQVPDEIIVAVSAIVTFLLGVYSTQPKQNGGT